ncbi:MAG: hypothetical protein DWQ51_18850 [Microcystis wesenbergii TW10]|uniref:Uncharacterized protein n=1 Tax=Microcystis wesenbergii TW10 TaxID=2060474 RepID=A0A3E0LMB1_9CHRO|nr:MAG: hypothetical protein DWQ51_18850 [Microcystis wesenbergii TW10]
MNDLDEHCWTIPIYSLWTLWASRTRKCPQAWEYPYPVQMRFNFCNHHQKREVEFPTNTLVLIVAHSQTIHADSLSSGGNYRWHRAIAAVDGVFLFRNGLKSDDRPVLAKMALYPGI